MWTGEHAHSIPQPRPEVVEAGRACAPQVANQVYDYATKALGLLQLALGAAVLVREGAQLFRDPAASARPVVQDTAPVHGLGHAPAAPAAPERPTMADTMAQITPMDAVFAADPTSLDRLRERSGETRQFQTARGRMF